MLSTNSNTPTQCVCVDFDQEFNKFNSPYTRIELSTKETRATTRVTPGLWLKLQSEL